MAETLKQQGAGADLPSDSNALVDLFGVGWWKYDVAEAAKLLESVGFKKDPGGKWLLPDGKPWTIAINAPADFEVESGRLAFAVADAWTKFGVETTAQPMSSGSFGDANATGKYQAGAYWPGCAIGADIYPNVNNWHQKHFVETGKPAFGNRHRLRSEKISSLLDQLETISADDPKNVELSKNLLLQMAQEMHWIPMFGTSKFVPVNDTYFTHYPTAKDSYEGPWWWWSNFKFIVANIEPKK